MCAMRWFQVASLQDLSIQFANGAITGTLKVVGTGSSNPLLTFLATAPTWMQTATEPSARRGGRPPRNW